jgi:superfamily I DNA and/or RNA helicase
VVPSNRKPWSPWTGTRRLELRCVEKVAEAEDDTPRIMFTKDNADVFKELKASRHVAAGAKWLWARHEAFESIDVLFVDEAAQMSLADVLAISQAAKSIVLLGDTQQLNQPVKGSHPEGVDVSALDYILGQHQTISADKGLFLEVTWRLHPDICAFTSELFYAGRLRSRKGLENQEIKSIGSAKGTGLRYIPVRHQGNRNSAPEEADRIRDLVNEILDARTTWIDREGNEHALTLDDILIVAPYNAQVFELQQRLPNANIGTVDKFQGQEAPIAIYSLTTSTHADAPRGMEFLYSLNRLNVATSRAKCICILVGSPALFEGTASMSTWVRWSRSLSRKFFRWGIAPLHDHAGGSATLSATGAYGQSSAGDTFRLRLAGKDRKLIRAALAHVRREARSRLGD